MMMSRRARKVQKDEVDGIILKVSGNNNYLVELKTEEGKTKEVLAHLSGNMRRFKINVLLGDKVKVVVPAPYDRGRIVFREK
jgi:translation initiation factor IF-1